MKIAVCGSMVFSKGMIELKGRLQSLGHEVAIPELTEEYARLDSQEDMHSESAHNKVEHDLIRGYFEKIRDSDAILIHNPARKGIDNYVGGNTFLEMGFAHVLRKPIFMQFPIPDMGYRDEMEAMNPIIINGQLEKIVS